MQNDMINLMPKSNQKIKPGFSLIELLIVITIIGVLATLGYVSYQAAQVKARDRRRKNDLIQIQTAIEHYRYDHDDRTVPKCSASGLCDVSTIGLTSDYIKSMPKDPLTNTNYNYQSYQSGGSIDCGGTSASTQCFSYILVACIENTKDPKKDSSTSSACSSSTNASYTLTSPAIQ